MRHKKSINHLSRKSAHRKALLANMAASLIKHKRIETTTAKAKALKRYIEPLITRSKEDTTHSRRVVFSHLQDKDAVTELFREVGGKVADRPGGYTRIIKLGHRLGDSADMCMIELVDYNENLLAEKAATKKSASRRRRGSKKPAATAAVEESKVESQEPEEVAETEAVEEVDEVASEEVPAAESEAVATEKTEVAEETEAEEPTAEASAEGPDEEDVSAEGPASEEEEPGEDLEETKG
jgi:large subunit ribosomal protein L17